MFHRAAVSWSRILLFGVILLPLSGWSSPVPVGPEFRVNAGTIGRQAYPKVAADDTGRFVVVWQDGYDPATTVGRRFDAAANPLGGDFQVNTVSQGDTSSYNNDGMASVDTGPGGSFVVVWYATDYGVPGCGGYVCPFMKRYDANGTALSGEVVLSTPASANQQHANPEIAIGGTGDFVVIWEGLDDGGGYFSDEGIVGRRVSAAGVPQNGEFQANTITNNYQGDYGWLSVAADAAANFVAVWSDGNFPHRIAGQRYDAAGNRLGGEFTVSDDAAYYPANPEVGMDSGGNFVVTWLGADGIGDGILARRFDSGGTALGTSFRVNTDHTSYSRYPAIDVDATGRFVVAWTSYVNNYDVFAKSFDSAGNAQGDEVRINGTTVSAQGYLGGPDVAMDSSGNFVVVWASYDLTSYDFDILGTRAVADGDRELTGAKLLLKNTVPDNPEMNQGSWMSRDPAIIVGARNSTADPRCNDDPPGTVKATIRFVSPSSGHDSGAIGLPCERWTAFGPDTATNLLQVGYKYRDTNRDSGPCTDVYVRTGKLARAKCVGRGPVAVFPYDLVPGTSEGTVNVTLDMGPLRLCTAFPGPPGSDGSDGKRFLAKNTAAPLACP